MTVKQYAARSAGLVPSLELIPPLAEEFSVYGDRATVERAREWASGWRLLLVEGVAKCAHGFYGMGYCPGECRSVAGFDHVNLWLPYDEPHRPFLLSAPYEDVEAQSSVYADTHGLRVDYLAQDGWYGSGTNPVRMTVKSDVQVFPLSMMAVPVLMAYPVQWEEER